jgi:hypothetical protein
MTADERYPNAACRAAVQAACPKRMLPADSGWMRRHLSVPTVHRPIPRIPLSHMRLRAHASKVPDHMAGECLHLVIGFAAGSVGGNALASRECTDVSCPGADRRPESNSKGPEVLFDATPFVTTPVNAHRHNNHFWTGPSSERPAEFEDLQSGV